MKIKNVRAVRNMIACFVSINLLVSQMAIPPFKREEEYTLNSYEDSVKLNRTRKLTNKNNLGNQNTTYHRAARNSLGKPNYYPKNKDF